MRSGQEINVGTLRRRLLAFAAAGAFTIGIGGAILAAAPLIEGLREESRHNLLHIGEVKAQAVAEYLRHIDNTAAQIAGRTHVRDILENYNSGGLSLEAFRAKAIPNLREALANTPDISGLTRLDSKGAEVLRLGHPLPVSNWPPGWDKTDRRLTHGPLVLPEGLCLVKSSPILSPDGRRVGTDIIVFDLRAVQSLLGYGASLGQTGTMFLTFPQGQEVLVAEVPRQTAGQIDATAELAPVPGLGAGAETNLPWVQMSGASQLATLGAYVFGYAPVEDSGWTVVIRQDATEVFAGLNNDLLFNGLGVLLLAGLGTLGILVLLRPLTGTLIIHADSLTHEVARTTAHLDAARHEAEQARGRAEAARRLAEDSLARLRETQESLIESEKMASLGGLVAGVAHEINTPVGIVVTSASHLEAETTKLHRLYEAGDITAEDMEEYLAVACEASQLILANANRAAELIHSFKQVAVDQTASEWRRVVLRGYLREVLGSLRPKLKQTALTVVEDGGEEIAAITCPGALSQILTNLVMNSIFHGFDEGHPGTLRITVVDCGEEVEIRYADDGKGIPRENLKRVFEPFFTTRREAGGSGLGLHIIYNLATRTLGGNLKLESEPGHGMAITLRFPKAGRADNGIQEEGERDGGEAGLRAASEERA